MTALLSLNPGFLLIVLGLVTCLMPVQRVRQAITIAAPLVGLALLTQAPQDMALATATVLGKSLILYQVDGLNFIFGLGFLIAVLLHAIYALHSDDRLQDGLALICGGAAIAAAFAGDFLTLFIFFELTALAGAFLVLRGGTRAAYFAGMRYIAIQILAGVLLLDGVAYIYEKTGTLELKAFESLSDPGAIFVLLAVGIKSAFPLLHNWLQDSYPKASVVGGVVLAAFTTKLAVLITARLFPGFEVLIWTGAVMAVFPVVFALIENDLRKVLAYALNSQVGFMICAIGVGTPLALNGAAALAFVHIIFVALLFMALGAVLHRTGTVKASELGGLYKSMPLTTVFCLVGAASISAFPLFSGYVAWPLVMNAVAGGGHTAVWLMLAFATVGMLVHTGLRLPYAAFFGRDKGWRVEDAPFNMLLAMGLAAAVSVLVGLPSFLGLGYGWLYGLLPYPDMAGGYRPYGLDTLLTLAQLLVVATLAFMILKRFGLLPADRPGTILDTDWTYRRLGYGFATWAGAVWAKSGPAMTKVAGVLAARAFSRIEAAFSPRGRLSRGPLTGGMAIWTAALLGAAMLLSFIAVN